MSLGFSIVACNTFGYALLGMVSYNQTWLVRMNELDFILWNQTYDMALFEGSDTLVECQDGGFAFTGTSNYFMTPDVMLVRTDMNGIVLWNQTYGGSGDYFSQGLVECEDGGFAFAGAKRDYDELEFNIWLVRTDPLGEIMWNTTYGDTAEYGIANALVKTSGGGFALTGYEDSFAGWYEVVFLVTGPSGEINNFLYMYGVLLIRILSPPNPSRILWLELALWVPIVVSVLIVMSTRWLFRSKKRVAEKPE